MLAETAGDDMPPGFADLIQLLQGMSRAMSPDDANHVDGAALGDFVIPRQDEQILVKGSLGYTFLIVGAQCFWPEYLPARAGFVESHSVKPPDTRWLKPHESPDGREGNYRQSNSNRIEETWYVPGLILLDDGRPPFIATYAFHGAACPIGRDMLRRAARKITVDGALVSNTVLTKWRMTSRSDKGVGGPYYLPQPTIVGRVGEERGPTAEQWRLAANLRKTFKQGLPFEGEPPLPPEPVERTPRPVITNGRPIVRSVEEPPPHRGYDGPDDPDYSEIPFWRVNAAG